jgi:hypothetical protein
MAEFSLPAKGTTQNTTTETPRAGHGTPGRRRAHVAPAVAEASAVAALAARLLGASATASVRLRHVEMCARAAGSSDACGRARGMTASQLGRLTPGKLLELLEGIVAKDHKVGGAGRVA